MREYLEDYNLPQGERLPDDGPGEQWRVIDAENAEVRHYYDFDEALKEYQALKYNRNSAVQYYYKGVWSDAFD